MRRIRRALIGGLLAACVALALFAVITSACATRLSDQTPEPQIPSDTSKGDTLLQVSGNLAIFTSAGDFEKGTHEGTRISTRGNGAVALKEGVSQGTYTSPEVQTKPFEYMIISWNADTPKGTYIEVEGRVHVGTQSGKQWSGWLSWGSWSSSAFTGEDGKVTLSGSAPSSNASDDIAKIVTDELIVIGSSGETADKFQYRLTLHGSDGKAGHDVAGPEVRLVAAAVRNTLPGQEIPVTSSDNAPDLTRLEKDLDVPAYSQKQRDFKISGSICSPTSVAMALGYHGIDVSPEQVAWGVYDYRANIFGNWPFNTAYASAHGLSAYVGYGVPAEGADPWYAVKKEINDGNPVIVSVRYRKPGYEGRTEPEVEGVPINYTAGHLVLVRGFTWRDGKEFVIVNDPAAATNEEVRRLYPSEQFFSAWVKQVMYVLHLDESEAANACVEAPIEGQLVPVGGSSGGFQKYELQVDGTPVNLSTTNMRSVVVSFNGEKTTPFNPRESSLSESSLMWFRADSRSGKYTFWFFDMNKNTYQAEIDWMR